MINEPEGLFEIQSETTKQYHEFSPLLQRDFYNYVQKLKQNIIVSLFEHNELSEVINIDVVFDDHFCHNIQLLKVVGSAQLKAFLNNRLLMSKVATSGIIYLNHFGLPGDD